MNTVQEIYDNMFFLIKESDYMVFKVKIISCDSLLSWYKNRIGDDFLVIDKGGDKLDVVVETGINGNRFRETGFYIRKTDAIIIKT